MVEQLLPKPNLLKVDHSKKSKFNIFLSNRVFQLLNVEQNREVESTPASLEQFK